MKNQVNFVYDIEDDPQDEVKHWLFLENVRLSQERQEINEQRQQLSRDKAAMEKEADEYKMALEVEEKKLIRQKELFEKQWQILENELRRLAKDKAALERERESFKKSQSQARTSSAKNQAKTQNTFFAGVCTGVALKKRYRELLKIYHPDNESGDSASVLIINQEYKILKKQFGLD